jgi:hypothetical protein
MLQVITPLNKKLAPIVIIPSITMFNFKEILIEGECEEFLHTFPHEDMHSQNSFGGKTTM